MLACRTSHPVPVQNGGRKEGVGAMVPLRCMQPRPSPGRLSRYPRGKRKRRTIAALTVTGGGTEEGSKP